MLLEKNPHFSSHQADILPTYEPVILVEYELNWMNIVDFLQIANCWFSPIFYCSYLSQLLMQITCKPHNRFISWVRTQATRQTPSCLWHFRKHLKSFDGCQQSHGPDIFVPNGLSHNPTFLWLPLSGSLACDSVHCLYAPRFDGFGVDL